MSGSLNSAKILRRVQQYQTSKVTSQKYIKQVATQQEAQKTLNALINQKLTQQLKSRLIARNPQLQKEAISLENESFMTEFKTAAIKIFGGIGSSLVKIANFILKNPAALMMVLAAMYTLKANAQCDPMPLAYKRVEGCTRYGDGTIPNGTFVISSNPNTTLPNVSPFYDLSSCKAIGNPNPLNLSDSSSCVTAFAPGLPHLGSDSGALLQVRDASNGLQGGFGYGLVMMDPSGGARRPQRFLQVQSVVKPADNSQYLEPVVYDKLIGAGEPFKVCISLVNKTLSFKVNGKELQNITSPNDILYVEAVRTDSDDGRGDISPAITDFCIEKLAKIKPEIVKDPVKKKKAYEAIIAGGATAFVTATGVVVYLVLKNRKKSRIAPLNLDARPMPIPVPLSEENQGILGGVPRSDV